MTRQRTYQALLQGADQFQGSGYVGSQVGALGDDPTFSFATYGLTNAQPFTIATAGDGATTGWELDLIIGATVGLPAGVMALRARVFTTVGGPLEVFAPISFGVHAFGLLFDTELSLLIDGAVVADDSNAGALIMALSNSAPVVRPGGFFFIPTLPLNGWMYSPFSIDVQSSFQQILASTIARGTLVSQITTVQGVELFGFDNLWSLEQSAPHVQTTPPPTLPDIGVNPSTVSFSPVDPTDILLPIVTSSRGGGF